MNLDILPFSGLFVPRNRTSYLVPVLIWIAGCLAGILCACYAGEPYFLMMRRAASAPVSISGLMMCTLLPFLIAAFAVCISKPSILYGVCFFKALLFSMAAFAIRDAFDSAGWLVRFLLQFSDICTLPLLCWFSIRQRHTEGRTLIGDLMLCSVMVSVVGVLDHRIISPFLVMLIDY